MKLPKLRTKSLTVIKIIEGGTRDQVKKADPSALRIEIKSNQKTPFSSRDSSEGELKRNLPPVILAEESARRLRSVSDQRGLQKIKGKETKRF